MELPDFTTQQWGIAVLAALCAGFSKAGLAGLGTFTVMLMAQLIPGKASSGAVLPLLIAADIMAAISFRQQILWHHILRLAWPIMAGILLGCGVLLTMPDAAFRPVVGWMVLLMLAVQLWRLRYPAAAEGLPSSTGFVWFAGILTGASTMIANAAGPVATVYLIMLALPKKEFISTMAWLFLFVNLSKVPFSYALGLITVPSLILNAALLPAVAAGLLAGRLCVNRIPQKAFQIIILSLCTLAAFRLILVP